MKTLPTFTVPLQIAVTALSNGLNKHDFNDFEAKLIKDTFAKCFGLKSCLKSVRTQGDAIVVLFEKTGLRISFIKDNLEQIINL